MADEIWRETSDVDVIIVTKIPVSITLFILCTMKFKTKNKWLESTTKRTVNIYAVVLSSPTQLQVSIMVADWENLLTN